MFRTGWKDKTCLPHSISIYMHPIHHDCVSPNTLTTTYYLLLLLLLPLLIPLPTITIMICHADLLHLLMFESNLDVGQVSSLCRCISFWIITSHDMTSSWRLHINSLG